MSSDDSLAALRRLAEGRDHAATLAACDKAIAHSPDVADVHVVRAKALLHLGKFEEAICSYQRAQELGETTDEILQGLGRCFMKAGRAAEAVPYLAESFYLEPKRSSAIALLGAAFSASELDQDLISMVFRSLHADYYKMHPGHNVCLAPYLSIGDWCAAHGVVPEVFDPGGEIRLVGAQGEPIAPYVAPPVRFVTISGGQAIAGLDYVFAPSGELLDFDDLRIEEQANIRHFVPFTLDVRQKRALHAAKDGTVTIDEDVVFLSARAGHGFGHWVFDHLPRLAARTRSGRPLKVFTLNSLPSEHRETLVRFQLTPADVIEGETGTRYRFRSITAPIAVHYLTPTRSIPAFVYDALAAKKTPLQSGIEGGRYFLERSRTIRRRNVSNRDEFDSLLEEFNFRTLRRPEISVADQDAMFSEARIIISPFGSDMVTFYQLRPGTDIILLIFEEMEKIYGWDIAEGNARYCAILGMRLHQVRCASAQRDTLKSDLIVDCAAVRRVLNQIIARRRDER